MFLSRLPIQLSAFGVQVGKTNCLKQRKRAHSVNFWWKKCVDTSKHSLWVPSFSRGSNAHRKGVAIITVVRRVRMASALLCVDNDIITTIGGETKNNRGEKKITG